MGTEDIKYHAKRALAEYAERLGKEAGQLEPQERSQAFFDYMAAGRHMEGAEGGGVDEPE